MSTDENPVRRESAFDEVFDGQATFRVLLDCMSRPGSIGQVPGVSWNSTPPGLSPAALTMLRTLCDHRVSFAVGGAVRAWTGYLEVNLSCPSRPVAEADYVLMDGGLYDPSLLTARRGSLEVPEGSATVFIGVARLSEGRGGGSVPIRLRGPGIRDTAELRIDGIDPRYLEARDLCNELPPMGIDLILFDADGQIVGLPRTCRVETA